MKFRLYLEWKIVNGSRDPFLSLLIRNDVCNLLNVFVDVSVLSIR